MLSTPMARTERRSVQNRQIAEKSYAPPEAVRRIGLFDLIRDIRPIPVNQQKRFGITPECESGIELWSAGDLSLLRHRCVAIVGARKVSPEGAARARRIARELAKAGFVIVSGLASGVDTEALTTAIEEGGRVVAVIGTGLDKASPVANKRLQERIYTDHLLISQFEAGRQVFPSNFPERNKLMAALSDATIIVEASDTSGSLHQAAECVRLGRWLFIANSLVENPALTWPGQFMSYPVTKRLRSVDDILNTLVS